MALARLILWERTTCWAPALRRATSDQAIRLVETRTWNECLEHLGEASHSVVALELAPRRADAVLAALEELDRQFPHAVPIVLASRSMRPHSPLMREAGAMLFASSPRRLDGVAQLIDRHLGRMPELKDHVTGSVRDAVWARMPWRE
jgi:DNA-binding NtrC family response regulator